mmetsp:Transcript_67040/g.136542  ORF Transcript_67040/g.136542 Transcript_67040/m.136542 type:complete len:219 (+) Transcript_67040:2250-2906(+)
MSSWKSFRLDPHNSDIPAKDPIPTTSLSSCLVLWVLVVLEASDIPLPPHNCEIELNSTSSIFSGGSYSLSVDGSSGGRPQSCEMPSSRVWSYFGACFFRRSVTVYSFSSVLAPGIALMISIVSFNSFSAFSSISFNLSSYSSWVMFLIWMSSTSSTQVSSASCWLSRNSWPSEPTSSNQGKSSYASKSMITSWKSFSSESAAERSDLILSFCILSVAR